MSESEGILDASELARTYNAGRGAYEDAWKSVEEYRRVMKYASEHPDKGYRSISSAIGVPAGRVRPWVDRGAKPNPVRAVDIARDYGWIDAEYGDTIFEGLNILVVNVFSGGSISSEDYDPVFTVIKSGKRSNAPDALERVGIEYDIYQKDDSNRSNQVRPTTHGRVLGRALSVLGAPVGSKIDNEELELPWYLDDAPAETRERFARTYVENRGQHRERGRTITLLERRPKPYLEELAAFLEDVSGEQVTPGDGFATVTAAAAESLGIEPRYFEPT